MEVLILGNGFEINFNKRLVDFNQTFKKWLLSHENSYRMQELHDKVSRVLDKNNISYQTNDLLLNSINYLINKIKNYNSNESVEDILFQIGSELSEKYREIDNLEQQNQVFTYFKTLFGTYINDLTLQSCAQFKHRNFDFLSKYPVPNYIFTTNYTDSARTLADEWSKKNYSIPTYKPEVRYLHGSFDEKDKTNAYKNIEINLTEKISIKFFEELANRKTVDTFNFSIFGLSMKNDHNVLKNIIYLLIKRKKISLNYYFFNNADKRDFKDAIDIILKGFGPDTKIILEFNEKEETFKVLDKNENIDTTFVCKFVEAKSYFLFKELQANEPFGFSGFQGFGGFTGNNW